MSILQATDANPVGAVALLAHGDPDELARFQALENAVWGGTSLPPAVIETIRLRSASIRGCAFCSAVRIRAAIEDGLSETQIALLDAPEHRTTLSDAQQAALLLVDLYLRDPRTPSHAEKIRLSEVLGSRGVVEVLLACAVFATADLRIALGENREPAGSAIVERARGDVAARSTAIHWPALHAAVLDPTALLPEVMPSLAESVRDLLGGIWSGTDIRPELIAACAMRSTQLLGIDADEPVSALLMPAQPGRQLMTAEQVRDWPAWSTREDRDILALAEQLWIDPAGVDETVTAPVAAEHGIGGVIRLTWDLIWIGQLHRLALVLHRGG